MADLRLAVLISGSGTNLQALLDGRAEGRLAGRVVAVVSDRDNVRGLERARSAGVPAHVVDYGSLLKVPAEEVSRHEFPTDLEDLDRVQRIIKNTDRQRRLYHLGRLVLAEQRLISLLDAYRPDYICLGFMRLVTPYFLSHYRRGQEPRVLNIHPALLPSFPGRHGYEDTFAYGCKWGGVTVHFVDEGEDTGPIVAQAVYPIWPEDDEEKVRKRGLQLEYEIYTQCINWLAAGQVELKREAGKRFRTVITDPAYPKIVRSWLEKSLSADD